MAEPTQPEASGPSSGSADAQVRAKALAYFRELPVSHADPLTSAPTILSTARSAPEFAGWERLSGKMLGAYRVGEPVGAGGMAAVLRARDTALDRDVALKILPPAMATEPENVTRFQQEARAAAKLDHPNIAHVYHCGEDAGLHYIAFEFVEGENLRRKMDRAGGKLPWRECVPILEQVAIGLAHAAARGVVHRDIKPSNIVVTPEGIAKIVDMGLARSIGPVEGALTHSGVTLGTFDYLSPEQAIDPRTADTRSDLYSLGCTFYHAVTGRPPVPDGTAARKLEAHRHEPPIDPRRIVPEIPEAFVTILARMMAKSPSDRYSSPEPLLRQLKTLSLEPSADHPEPPRQRLTWILAATFVLVVCVVSLTTSNRRPDTGPAWTNDKPPAKPKIPLLELDIAEGPRGAPEARTVGELTTLLKQGATVIRLTGREYDLTESPTPETVVNVAGLLLEGIGATPPTIRLAWGPTEPTAGWTFRSANDTESALQFRNLRLELVASEEAEPTGTWAGLRFNGALAVCFDRCTLTSIGLDTTARRGEVPAAIRIVSNGARLTTSHLFCGPMPVALRVVGRAEVTLQDSAILAERAVVQVRPGDAGDPDDPPMPIRVEHCSIVCGPGAAVIDVPERTAVALQVGGSILTGEHGQRMGRESVVWRQRGERHPQSGVQGTGAANVYYQIGAFYSTTLGVLTREGCRTNRVAWDDPTPRDLADERSPWRVADPLATLHKEPRVDPRQLLAIAPDLPALRTTFGVPIGANNLPAGGVAMEASTMPRVVAEAVPDGVRVWVPDWALDKPLPANMYRSLTKALDDARPGDVISVRHDGELEIEPREFRKADLHLTFRADGDSRPILVAEQPRLKRDSALFKLYGGQLTFEGLRFRLKADRVPAIVALPGGGQVAFRECVITVEESDDPAVITLPEPRGEMMMMPPTERPPTPRVSWERCMVRGKGDLIRAAGGRAFECDIVETLIALDGSLIETDAPMNDATTGSTLVRLKESTVFSTESIVRRHGPEKRADGKRLPIAPLTISATHCLFVPAAAAALIEVDHAEADATEPAVAWKDGAHNSYGWPTEQPMYTVTDGERLDRERWKDRIQETGSTFGEVRFRVMPASKRFDGVQASDFEPQGPRGPSRPGVPLDRLRVRATEP